MTTSLTLLEGGKTETLTEAVARRLRGQMAERQITSAQLAAMTGLGRATISRRITGATALNTDEFQLIESATGISAEYLLTGKMPASFPGPDSDPENAGGAPSRTRTYDLRIKSP